MPLKGSRKVHNKNNFLGENSKNKKVMSSLQEKLSEQQKVIKSLEDKIRYRKKKKKLLKEKLSNVENESTPVIAVSTATRKRRQKKPTDNNIAPKAKQQRTSETFNVCSAIHGGTPQNDKPTITGMLMTLSSKCGSSDLSKQILAGKKSLVKEIKTTVIKDSTKKYYDSNENTLRSINFYYSQDILGKRKYEKIRTANKCPNVANF